MNEGINPRCAARDSLPDSLPRYQAILLAVDSSDHANRGIGEAAAVAGASDAQITAAHVYAAAMHDMRFRQMEGGLPEPFRQERELERQRDVHDDLIHRGLSVITDSYLDQAERVCKDQGVRFAGCSLEGKNYRALVAEANSGRHDLLVIGALGLGAVPGSRLGTVCRRVVRRTAIDALVIKEPQRSLCDGPIVVALDGSTRSYGGLMTALALARDWNVAVHVVAAYDPHYHYVAFNRIAGVLSEEASKVFRFKEQEKLHEEIIDSGLAKIYQGHLQVAQTIAGEHGLEITTELLAGKPHVAIVEYLRRAKPSLLVIGKLGIHADADLDIGGNAENLLFDADCAVLLSQRTSQPRIDMIAQTTTSWTVEAERRMENVPSFVQRMARMAILRYAQERGHTVITERIVEEATALLMPRNSEKAAVESTSAGVSQCPYAKRAAEKVNSGFAWTPEAERGLLRVPSGYCRDMTRKAAETIAMQNGLAAIDRDFLQTIMKTFEAGAKSNQETMPWAEPARGRIARAPETVRGMLIKEIEAWARREQHAQVDENAVHAVTSAWTTNRHFHLDPNDPRSQGGD